MSSYNQCTIVGNLTTDPETKIIQPSETMVLESALAVNRVYKDKQGRKIEDVDFIPFVAFGKGAETLAKYVRKGDSVLLSGSIRQDRWETDEGEKRSKMKLRVENFTLLNNNPNPNAGRRGNGGKSEPAPSASAAFGEDVPY